MNLFKPLTEKTFLNTGSKQFLQPLKKHPHLYYEFGPGEREETVNGHLNTHSYYFVNMALMPIHMDSDISGPESLAA